MGPLPTWTNHQVEGLQVLAEAILTRDLSDGASHRRGRVSLNEPGMDPECQIVDSDPVDRPKTAHRQGPPETCPGARRRLEEGGFAADLVFWKHFNLLLLLPVQQQHLHQMYVFLDSNTCRTLLARDRDDIVDSYLAIRQGREARRASGLTSRWDLQGRPHHGAAATAPRFQLSDGTP